jgi:peroxiredoxin
MAMGDLGSELRGPERRTLVSPQALAGAEMPSILFNNFDRRFLDLGEIAATGLVLYLYPGCEHSPADGPESLHADALQHRTYTCLRKRFAELVPDGALVAVGSISPTLQFHLSPELAWEQDEDAPFQHYLVSDETLQLAEELGLPTFQHEGETYYERLTLIARAGRIQRVFHPVTPGQDARQALTWLQLH